MDLQGDEGSWRHCPRFTPAPAVDPRWFLCAGLKWFQSSRTIKPQNQTFTTPSRTCALSVTDSREEGRGFPVRTVLGLGSSLPDMHAGRTEKVKKVLWPLLATGLTLGDEPKPPRAGTETKVPLRALESFNAIEFSLAAAGVPWWLLLLGTFVQGWGGFLPCLRYSWVCSSDTCCSPRCNLNWLRQPAQVSLRGGVGAAVGNEEWHLQNWD